MIHICVNFNLMLLYTFVPRKLIQFLLKIVGQTIVITSQIKVKLQNRVKQMINQLYVIIAEEKGIKEPMLPDNWLLKDKEE